MQQPLLSTQSYDGFHITFCAMGLQGSGRLNSEFSSNFCHSVDTRNLSPVIQIHHRLFMKKACSSIKNPQNANSTQNNCQSKLQQNSH